MRNSKKCSKCGSVDIIHVPGTVGGFGAGNNIAVGRTVFSSVKVSRYLCASCGFLEEWIDSPSDMEQVKQKYK